MKRILSILAFSLLISGASMAQDNTLAKDKTAKKMAKAEKKEAKALKKEAKRAGDMETKEMAKDMKKEAKAVKKSNKDGN